LGKRLRVGVVGAGVMGKNHARVYSELPDVELVGIADTDNSLATELAQTYNTEAFGSYGSLLELGLDAVSIAVPTSMHRQVAIDTAQARAHMLVEKPIADTAANAEEIIKAAEQNGVKLMVGHIERFNPIVLVLKKSMEAAEVISINITRVGPFPPRIRDVGVIIDFAIHDIDLIRYLTGSEVRKVYSLVSKTNLSEHEDGALLSFEMENGCLAHLTANWLTPFKVREINIAARRKFIKGWFQEQKVWEYRQSGEDNSYIVKELPVPFAEPLRLELEAFLEAVKNDQKVPVSGEEGLKALEIAIQCVNLGSKADIHE
jgi:UDP-N-acetylglucosamine 3-dehydrogenase